MNNKEFDLEQFADMFDTAMNSDNPTVQKCFNNLLMVVALAHAENKDVHYGPLRKLVDDVNDLKRRLTFMESLMNPKNTPYTGGINNPIWVSTTTTGSGYVPPNSGPYSISTH